jgi:hypothetical protein
MVPEDEARADAVVQSSWSSGHHEHFDHRPKPARVQHPEQGLPGYHDPMAHVGGASPAISPLTLRLVLAIIGVCFGIVAAISFAWADAPLGVTIFMIALALVAVVDIVVVTRRKRRGEPG